ncbi:hypothetical protein BDGGKGIB_03682 [Nodularia sphaerocarpa UHCC 0038]|nr:hypothetical protein BDGGKGIB_03682 [Nodularia sphaerocarpa UHCC 0038]
MTMAHLWLMSGAIVGCHAWGKTPDEARAELVYVFEMIQEEYE